MLPAALSHSQKNLFNDNTAPGDGAFFVSLHQNGEIVKNENWLT
jgi:hypothetical protein